MSTFSFSGMRLQAGPRRPVLSVALLLTLAVAGCGGSGPKLAQVEGTVTLDGQPLANMSLMFTPIEGTAGNGAGGTSDTEGNYTLKAMIPGATKDYPGIGPGRYRVMVFEPTLTGDVAVQDEGDEPAVALAPGMGGGKSKIPAVYGTENSPLVVEVPEAGGEIDLALQSKPGA